MIRSRRSILTLVALGASIFTVSCGHPTGSFDVDPVHLHLHAHGAKGQIVLQEADYGGLYYKTTDRDPKCAASVYATPEPRRRGDPAHLDVMPHAAGSCLMYLFDDHGGLRDVAIDVSP